MTNGRKTLTKLNTHVGSKLFRLAMFPVPKNDINSRWSYGVRENRVYAMELKIRVYACKNENTYSDTVFIL